MKFQYCLWDKLKELEKLQSSQMINLAKLLAHLFLEKGLPISALKVKKPTSITNKIIIENISGIIF